MMEGGGEFAGGRAAAHAEPSPAPATPPPDRGRSGLAHQEVPRAKPAHRKGCILTLDSLAALAAPGGAGESAFLHATAPF